MNVDGAVQKKRKVYYKTYVQSIQKKSNWKREGASMFPGK